MEGVAAERDKLRSAKMQIEVQLIDGKRFFATAISAVDAWANAHADLVKAFQENRAPNLVLVAARAQELKQIIDNLR